MQNKCFISLSNIKRIVQKKNFSCINRVFDCFYWVGVVSELKVHKNACTSFIKWQTDVFIFLSLSSQKKRRNKKLGSWSIRREHFWRKTFLKAEAKHLDNLVRDINPFLQNRWVEEILPLIQENQLKNISFHSSNYWHYLQFLDAPVSIA